MNPPPYMMLKKAQVSLLIPEPTALDKRKWTGSESFLMAIFRFLSVCMLRIIVFSRLCDYNNSPFISSSF